MNNAQNILDSLDRIEHKIREDYFHNPNKGGMSSYGGHETKANRIRREDTEWGRQPIAEEFRLIRGMITDG